MSEARGTPEESRLRQLLADRDAKIKDLVGKLRAQEQHADRLRQQRDDALAQVAEERRRVAELTSHLAGERRRLEALATDYERLQADHNGEPSAEHLAEGAP